MSLTTDLLAPWSDFTLWMLLHFVKLLIKLPVLALWLAWEFRQPIWIATWHFMQWLWTSSATNSAKIPVSTEETPSDDPPDGNHTMTNQPDCHGECISALASVFVLLGLGTKF